MKVYPMRRKDRQAGEEDILRILKENVYGVLSTISEDGWPYGVPVSYVYEDGKIYFHSATMGHKVDNLAHSEKASFCVVGKTELLPEQFSTPLRIRHRLRHRHQTRRPGQNRRPHETRRRPLRRLPRTRPQKSRSRRQPLQLLLPHHRGSHRENKEIKDIQKIDPPKVYFLFGEC